MSDRKRYLIYPGVAIHLPVRRCHPIEILQVGPNERNAGDGVGWEIGNGDKGTEEKECQRVCVCVFVCMQK